MRRSPIKRSSTPMRRTRMKRVSVKGAARRAVRSDLVARILDARPLCELGDALEQAIEGHRCERFSVHVHEPHSRGRGGSALDAENTAATCAACHAIVHENPAIAEALGLLRSDSSEALGPERPRQKDPAVSIFPGSDAQQPSGFRSGGMDAASDNPGAQVDAERELRVYLQVFALEHGRGPTVSEIVEAHGAIARVHLVLGEMVLRGHVVAGRVVDGGAREMCLTLRGERVGVSSRFNDRGSEHT